MTPHGRTGSDWPEQTDGFVTGLLVASLERIAELGADGVDGGWPLFGQFQLIRQIHVRAMLEVTDFGRGLD